MNSRFLILNFKLVQGLLVILTIILFPRLAIAGDISNKYGIHLAQPHLEDFAKVKEMINSNGGDWGYVTLVLEQNDRNYEKWQTIFDRLRELHLIPIIRLATYPEGEVWHRPEKEDAESWVNFLDSLNWVVKKRYIVLFNEPNHGSEWGSEVDPENYVTVALEFAKKLKEKNQDFFIMLAGMDASAPSYPPNMEDEEEFLKQIFSRFNRDSIFNFIDGIASHSYPNPGFAGSPYAGGRGTVRTYQWEIELYKQLTGKELPVFITETGWVRQCQMSNVKCQNENIISNNFRIAFEEVWGPDDRVKAVTPFVFDYQGEPFLGFSWKMFQSQDFYPQYYTIQSLTKNKGQPEIIEKGEIKFDFPKELVVNSNFHFRLPLKNLGQSIWDKDDGYELGVRSYGGKPLEYFFSDLKKIKPFEETTIDLYVKTNSQGGNKKATVILTKDGKKIAQGEEWSLSILPLPELDIQIGLYPKLKTIGDDFEVQIYNNQEELVYKKSGIKIEQGQGKEDNVQNIILGKPYRIVILKPYYLPRQEMATISRGANKVKFKLMYPLDFNKDGRLSLKDLSALLKNPKLLGLFLP